MVAGVWSLVVGPWAWLLVVGWFLQLLGSRQYLIVAVVANVEVVVVAAAVVVGVSN